MGRRSDYQRIGDLVHLCAQAMKMLSAEQRGRGIDCPFRPVVLQLEQLSREIRLMAASLPAEWDRGADAILDS